MSLESFKKGIIIHGCKIGETQEPSSQTAYKGVLAG